MILLESTFNFENWGIVIASIALIITLASIFIRGGKILERVKDMKINTDKIPGVETRLSVVETKTNLLEKTVTILVKRFDKFIDKFVDKRFFESKSPLQLNEYGRKVLEESGINNIIEKHYDDILAIVKTESPTNAYRAQEYILTLIGILPERHKDIVEPLEKAAFQLGIEPRTILRVGAIHIRDRILKDIGLDKDDIDKHDPDK